MAARVEESEIMGATTQDLSAAKPSNVPILHGRSSRPPEDSDRVEPAFGDPSERRCSVTLLATSFDQAISGVDSDAMSTRTVGRYVLDR